MKFVFLTIVLIISLQTVSASSGTFIEVSPEYLNFVASPSLSAEKLLYVTNTGNETLLCNILVDNSTYENWFTFSPYSFEIGAGESREVKVTFTAPQSYKTYVTSGTKISLVVSGKENGREVTIPVHVRTSTSENISSERISSGKNSSEERIGLMQVDFTENTTHLNEELKNSVKNLELIVSRNFNRVSVSFYTVSKSFDDTNNYFSNGSNSFGNLRNLCNNLSMNFSNVSRSFDNTSKDFDEKVRSFNNKTIYLENSSLVNESTNKSFDNTSSIFNSTVETFDSSVKKLNDKSIGNLTGNKFQVYRSYAITELDKVKNLFAAL